MSQPYALAAKTNQGSMGADAFKFREEKRAGAMNRKECICKAIAQVYGREQASRA